MLKFSEELLQFIWRHRLLKPVPLISASGKEIIVLKPGEQNHCSGPDFFNCHLRIDGLLLAGNVEIHLRSSDWLRHHHQEDSNYDKLALHVVYEHDIEVPQNSSHGVEVLELKELVDESTILQYKGLLASNEVLPCAHQLMEVDGFKFSSWAMRMAVERLQVKAGRVEEIFNHCNGDHIQTFYTLLLRAFGFNVNAQPFEMLARVLPARLLLRHADNLLQLEALLLGAGGFLQEQFEDVYIRKLQNEFEFLSSKYKLLSLDRGIFKFSGLRPSNFPTLRLAEFAALIHHHPSLLLHPESYESTEVILHDLRNVPGEYWKSHYLPDGRSSVSSLGLGKISAENIVINCFAPFFFFYGTRNKKEEFTTRSLELLEACAPEYNFKTRHYSEKTSCVKSAAHSQGLIHLYDNYCRSKRCLQCGVGMEILKRPLQKSETAIHQ